jgi:hypothetical protein
MKSKTNVKVAVFFITIIVISNLYNISSMIQKTLALESIEIDLYPLIAYPFVLAIASIMAKNKYLKRSLLILLCAVIIYHTASIIAKDSMIITITLLSFAVILHIPVIVLEYRAVKNHIKE